MAELERDLWELGARMDFPPTPGIATRVIAPLREEPPPPRLVSRSGRRALAIAVSLTLLLAGTVLASSAVREAARELLGLEGVTIERANQPAPPFNGEGIGLGERVPLAEAASEVAFEPLVPAALGSPDSAYVRDAPPGGQLSLVYEPRPGLPAARLTGLRGLLITEFRGDLAPEYLGKVLGPGSRVRRLGIEGAPAIWIAGAPHTLLYRSPSGEPRETRVRAARRVLLLERGRLLIRFESGLNRRETVEIARSLERVGNQ
jgi:hypothetical protein